MKFIQAVAAMGLCFGLAGLAQAQSIAGVWQVTEPPQVIVDGDLTPVQLTIEPDGFAAVFAGCNRYRSRVQLDGETIVFAKGFAGTLMACPKPLLTRDMDVIAAFEAIAEYSFDGTVLLMLDAQGHQVMSLKQVES